MARICGSRSEWEGPATEDTYQWLLYHLFSVQAFMASRSSVRGDRGLAFGGCRGLGSERRRREG